MTDQNQEAKVSDQVVNKNSTIAPGTAQAMADKVEQSAEMNSKIMGAVLDHTEIGKSLEAAGLDRETIKQLTTDQLEKFNKDQLLTQICNRYILEILKDIHIKVTSRKRHEDVTEKYWRRPLRANNFHEIIGEKKPAANNTGIPGNIPQAPAPQIIPPPTV